MGIIEKLREKKSPPIRRTLPTSGLEAEMQHFTGADVLELARHAESDPMKAANDFISRSTKIDGESLNDIDWLKVISREDYEVLMAMFSELSGAEKETEKESSNPTQSERPPT